MPTRDLSLSVLEASLSASRLRDRMAGLATTFLEDYAIVGYDGLLDLAIDYSLQARAAEMEEWSLTAEYLRTKEAEQAALSRT